MKEATIALSISKEHTYAKSNITPIEAMLLVAEHHKNFGDNPVKVDKDSIKEIVVQREVEKEVTEGSSKVKRMVIEKSTRTTDEELDRLRGKYANGKVEALMAKVRDMPDTFEAAIERGLKITLPTGALSTTKII